MHAFGESRDAPEFPTSKHSVSDKSIKSLTSMGSPAMAGICSTTGDTVTGISVQLAKGTMRKVLEEIADLTWSRFKATGLVVGPKKVGWMSSLKSSARLTPEADWPGMAFCNNAEERLLGLMGLGEFAGYERRLE